MADEQKVIRPEDGVEHGYWGTLPSTVSGREPLGEKDRREFTVEVQGPRAVEANKGGANAAGGGGTGVVDKDAPARQRVAKGGSKA